MKAGNVFHYTWKGVQTTDDCLGIMINDIEFIDVMADDRIISTLVYNNVDSISVQDVEILFSIDIKSLHRNEYSDDKMVIKLNNRVLSKYVKIHPERVI